LWREEEMPVAYVSRREVGHRRLPSGVGLLIGALLSAALWAGIIELISLL
jgi:hypothetical protein